jgi:hypothetical protein
MTVAAMREELKTVYCVSEKTLQQHTGNLKTLLSYKRLQAAQASPSRRLAQGQKSNMHASQNLTRKRRPQDIEPSDASSEGDDGDEFEDDFED